VEQGVPRNVRGVTMAEPMDLSDIPA